MNNKPLQTNNNNCEAILPARTYQEKNNIKTQEANSNHLIFVLYDGIQNSVFSSQVLHPLLKMLAEQPNLEVTLVSFEKTNISKTVITKLIPAHDRLHLILGGKMIFFGKTTLYYSAYGLYKILKNITCHRIIARGPLAGWITEQALKRLLKKKHLHCNPLYQDAINQVTIQARGLCAEEYRFEIQFQKSNFLKRSFQKFKYNQLYALEQETYNKKTTLQFPLPIRIESVSNALKEYLVKQFKADEKTIFIATHDIPQPYGKDKIQTWRTQTRQLLSIPESTTVYAYSGSAKPWQCAEETIFYFLQQHANNPDSILLILSGDNEYFERLCSSRNLNKNSYRILRVAPEAIYEYLAAADIGMLFRHTDIINWVSRPTKALEYLAVGLKIAHNHTIGWLEEQGNLKN